MTNLAHSEHSTLRERIIEHIFVGEALRLLWRRGVYDVEVLRSEFDAHGYDLVMQRGAIIRHIQLKTGKFRRPGDVSIALELAQKPSGCVLWIGISDNLDLNSFFFFGGPPGEPLPKTDHYPHPRRPTHNGDGVRPERTRHRSIPGSEFIPLESLDKVLDALFWALP